MSDFFVKTYPEVAVIAAAGGSVLASLPDAEDIGSVRIHIKNTGSVAFDAAKLQGSFNGTVWEDIDATAFTAKFGTLAGGAEASYFADNILWFPYLQVVASANTNPTTAVVKILVVRTDVI